MTHKDISFTEVDEILRIIDQFPAAQIVYERGDLKLHVRRAGAAPVSVPANAAEPPVAAAPSAPVAPAPAPSQAATSVTSPVSHDDVDRSGQVAIESPMMGVYYAAPAPGAKPFVSMGQKVARGDDLCIIEVMKVMNTVKAPCAGTIGDINAHNGAVVERGQALMWIVSLEGDQ